MTAKQDLAEETRAEEAQPEESAGTARDETGASTTTDAPSEDERATVAGSTSGEEASGERASGERASGEGASGVKGGRRVTRARILGMLAAMLVAALAATAVLQWISASQAEDARARLEAERSLRLEVSGAATAFSKALLSYDYRNLQSTRSTLAAQATGDFLATYDAAFGGAMAQVIVKLKATSQATVREVYLADVDEATAHAIVVVDQQVNTSEAIRSVKDSHLKISLVKEKGVWKIHDVTVLGAASEDQYNLTGDKKKE
ncbi:hypothetical protein [Nonomuraea helvata]|uniref:Mce-associated membrane protein n=1 Tax=Nonomuraea helvata TaxID=37484 RepID=A0ABV5S4B8_9ACTN